MKQYNAKDLASMFAPDASSWRNGSSAGTADVTDEELVLVVDVSAAWEGLLHVVYRRDGKLYWVTGSHCSCHGYEGQWSPQETTLEVLGKSSPEDWETNWNAEQRAAWAALVRGEL